MILALPNNEDKDIISSFELEEILDTNKNSSKRVFLKMPKFKVDYKNDLVSHYT